jgi:hypothetical protein
MDSKNKVDKLNAVNKKDNINEIDDLNRTNKQAFKEPFKDINRTIAEAKAATVIKMADYDPAFNNASYYEILKKILLSYPTNTEQLHPDEISKIFLNDIFYLGVGVGIGFEKSLYQDKGKDRSEEDEGRN